MTTTAGKQKTFDFDKPPAPDPPQDDPQPADEDRLADAIARHYALRGRAHRLLRVLLARCDDEGRCPAMTERELSRLTGDSVVTIRRAADDLQRIGVVTGRWRRGTPKRYRIRLDVLPRAVGHAAQGGDLGQWGQGDLGHPSDPHIHSADGVTEVTPSGDLGPPPHTIAPPERLIDRSIDRSVDEGDPGQPSDALTIPRLPAVVWHCAETELPEHIARWCDDHRRNVSRVAGGPRAVLGAVLAARHADAVNPDRYLTVCLRQGVAQGYLARAHRLTRGQTTPAAARSPPAYSPHGLPADDPQVRAARRRRE